MTPENKLEHDLLLHWSGKFLDLANEMQRQMPPGSIDAPLWYRAMEACDSMADLLAKTAGDIIEEEKDGEETASCSVRADGDEGPVSG